MAGPQLASRKEPYMRRILFSLLSLLAVFSAFALVFPLRGDGRVKTESRKVSSFSAIAMTGVGELAVERGPACSVTVSLDGNLLPHYVTSVERGVLRLGFEQGTSVRDLTRLEVRVTMPAIEALGLSGAAKAEIHPGFSGKALDLELSGAGSLVAALDHRAVTAGISGAGRLALSGRAEDLDLELSGTGRLDGRDFTIARGKLGISGAGSATLRATESLDADISGTGSVRYYGDPRVTQHVSGVGSVQKAGS